MRTPASIKNHPVHPMIVPFPIALWGFSLASDLFYWKTRRKAWLAIADATMQAGIIGGASAAIPGFIDFLSISKPHVKKTAWFHFLLNAGALTSYTANMLLRKGKKATSRRRKAAVLSGITMAVLAVSGWLGGSLVYEHHVGVTASPIAPPARPVEVPF